MAMNAAGLTAAADGFKTAYPYLSLHTTGAVSSSTNESTAARVAASWVNTNGTLSIASKNFTGGAASGPVVRVGYWSASTGGTYGGGSLLTGDQAFNAAGQYTVNTLTETPSAS